MKRYIAIALFLLIGGAVSVWLYRHFSPFHVCLRYYEIEAIEAGQNRDSAKTYARNLCTAKNPLRN